MSQLDLPYDSHPEFQFDSPAIELDREAVEAFGAAYARLEAADLTDVARRQEEAAAQQQLGRVFDDLLGRSPDDTFRAFLSELKHECQRVLAADFRHFAGRDPGYRAPAARDGRFAELDSRRFFLGQISPACVSALQAVAAAPVEGLRANAARGKVTRDDLSINYGHVARDIVAVLDPEYEKMGVNDAVSAYAKKRMAVCGVALELSVPTATWWRNRYRLQRPPQTLYVHTDEGLDYPKSIVYLTDVGADNGPMSVYPACEARLGLNPLQKLVGRIVGSVGARPESSLYALYARAEAHQGFSSPKFREHFSLLPRALKYNSHFGWDVVPDSALERDLVGAEVSVRGPAGTFAVFDGSRLLHRGGLVERGERVALQVIFAEPKSFVSKVRGRLQREVQARLGATNAVLGRLRATRVRLGRSVRRLSRSPAERLGRGVERILPPLVCVDIGASYYPHPAWELFRSAPKTIWVAVEPNEKNTAYLRDWRWASTPKLEPIGLSETGGEQLLYVTNVDSGSSLLPPEITPNMAHRTDRTDQDYFFPVTEKRIRTKSLAEILAAHGGGGELPVVLKLDTQGSELSILRGAERYLAAHQVVGIETEATMLAEPYMKGSGKFWEVCRFLEERGFELIQLKPIEAAPKARGKLRGRTYLNECDATFVLKRKEAARTSPRHQLALLGFYLSYQLYEEAASLFDQIAGIEAICAAAGVSAAELRRLLRE